MRTADHDDARLSPAPPATGTAHLPPAPTADLVQRSRRSSATPSARPGKAAPRRHWSSWDVRSHFSTPFGSSTGPSSSCSRASPRSCPPGHSARTPSSRPSPRGCRRSGGHRALARAHRAERVAAGPLPTRPWGSTAADAPLWHRIRRSPSARASAARRCTTRDPQGRPYDEQAHRVRDGPLQQYGACGFDVALVLGEHSVHRFVDQVDGSGRLLERPPARNCTCLAGRTGRTRRARHSSPGRWRGGRELRGLCRGCLTAGGVQMLSEPGHTLSGRTPAQHTRRGRRVQVAGHAFTPHERCEHAPRWGGSRHADLPPGTVLHPIANVALDTPPGPASMVRSYL